MSRTEDRKRHHLSWSVYLFLPSHTGAPGPWAFRTRLGRKTVCHLTLVKNVYSQGIIAAACCFSGWQIMGPH